MINILVIFTFSFFVLTMFAGHSNLDLSDFIQSEQERVVSEKDCTAMSSLNAEIFDWSVINSSESFQRHLLHLATIFESWEAMADWLTCQGFVDVQIVSNTQNRLYLNATWDNVRSGFRMPFEKNLPFYQRWLNGGSNYSVQVIYEKSKPISANAHHKVKWVSPCPKYTSQQILLFLEA